MGRVSGALSVQSQLTRMCGVGYAFCSVWLSLFSTDASRFKPASRSSRQFGGGKTRHVNAGVRTGCIVVKHHARGQSGPG